MIEPTVLAGWILWPGLGLCLGSFANVLIHRLPKDESIIWPDSHCPRCRAPIAFYDNIPLLSFLVLRGRCRNCRKPISARYPLVEAVVAVGGTALWLRWPGDWVWTLLSLLAVAALTAITCIDWDELIIPDELSFGLLALGLLASPFNPLFSGGPLWRAAQSLGGAAAGFGICWGVAMLGEKIFKKDAMGGGDVKLLAAIGAWTGALGAYDCILIASLIGAAYGGSLLLRKKIRRQDPIPFGPFLSAAAVFNLFYLLPFGFPFHNL